MKSKIGFKSFTIFYVVIAIANIIAIAFVPDFFKVTKALIMASLLGFYAFEVIHQSKALILGMIAALLGDAFLLFETQEFFMIGMMAFLVMQICYTYRFSGDRRPDYLVVPYIPIVFVLIALSTVWTMKHNLNSLFIPILVYSLAIALMASFAYWRKSSIAGYGSVYMGAILFMISDFVLALNKFHVDIPKDRYIVMITYMLAQYMIITGLVRQEKRFVKR